MIRKTDIESIKANVHKKHIHLLTTNRRYRKDDAEGRWLVLTQALQDFYYNEVGISSNDLWKQIDVAAGEYLDLEEYLYTI